MKKAVSIAAFAIFLGLWTWKLLEPHPLPESVEKGIPMEMSFWLAKTLHAGAYSFLTVLAASIPTRRSSFLALVVLLAIHGVGTEIGQRFVPNRHGCVRDVIIDWGGISMGLLGLWAIGWNWRETSNNDVRQESLQDRESTATYW